MREGRLGVMQHPVTARARRCASRPERGRASSAPVLRRLLLVGVGLFVVLGMGPPARTQSNATPANFRVAFIGDQGNGSNAGAVLALIANEGAEAVLHSGDFDYDDRPQEWDDLITAFLGADFPYFASVGNHDEREFYGSGGYQEHLEGRMNRLGIPWQGDLGVQSSFRFGGIFFVLTAPGIFGDGDGLYDVYIREQLAADDSTWRISSFHKNMEKLQVGVKNDTTGWGVYEESRRGGAIIATGHSHTYSRTHLLSEVETQAVASFDNTLVLARDDPATPEDEGRSFVFVSGIAGSSIRDQKRCLPTTPPYGCQGEWASIYSADQDARPGALFGVFSYQGDPKLAYFYFKDIDGNVVDSFFVRSPGSVAPVVARDDGPYVVPHGASVTRVSPGVLDNDQGSPVAAVLASDVQSGTLSLASDGSFTYSHDGSAVTSDSFSYRASDGSRQSNEATARISVHPTLEVPGDFSSIQDALDAASSGDLILVAPGTYPESLTVTKAVTLASWFATTGDPAYIEQTILDGGGGAAVISIPSGAEDGAAIIGFTIQNADDGIAPWARFDLLHNRVRLTTDGADYEDGSGGICRHNVFEDNGDDGVDLDSAIDIVVESNVMRNNGGDGMEIRLQPYTGPTLHYVIRGNQIHGNGEDGIQLIDYDVPTDRRFEIAGNAIHDNAQAGLGMMSGANTNESFEGASIEEPIRVIGNTFVGNDHGMTGGDNAVVLNNLFVDHTTLSMKRVDGNSEVAYNLFHGNAEDALESNVDSATTLSADPLLEADLSLSPGSPAIDAGTDYYVWRGETVLDLDVSEYSGVAPDLGAFEFVSGGPVAPPVPRLEEPFHGSTGVSLTPTLVWADTADFYEAQIASAPDFSAGSLVQDVVVSGGAVELTVGTGVLAPETPYFWRVRGSRGGAMGGWSQVWSFVTEARTLPPEAPVLVSPLDGSVGLDLAPALAWLGSADDFRVQVASDAGFSAIVVDTLVAGTSLAIGPDPLAHATRYWWRVLGGNAIGDGPWSTVSSFTTVPPPLALIPPSNLHSPSQRVASVELAWDPSPDLRVTGYRVYQDGVPVAAAATPSYEATGLASASLYRFAVSALDGAGGESLPTAELQVSTQDLVESRSISVRVTADDDDAEERISSGGSISLGSPDLELVKDGSRDQVVGVRFRGIDVPQGTPIWSAQLRFTVDEVSTEATSLSIEGEASGDAAIFSSTDQDVTSRPRTSRAVAWDPPPWDNVGDSGPAQTTPDLAAVVQEIVDRPDWSAGNAMAFVVSGVGRRTAEAHDGSSMRAALLELEIPSACSDDLDADGFGCDLDCDDGDASVHPGADELCDGRDNDCDGSVDEQDAVDAPLWSADFDRDGYGDPGHQTAACTKPPAWVADANDCNDADPTVSPSAMESCDDGRDNDCDGAIDFADVGSCAPISLSLRVSTSADDAEERISEGGSVSLPNADLELVEDGPRMQAVGVRFPGVDVLRASTITGAWLQFTADELSPDVAQLTIEGEASDDARAFEKTDGNVTSRPRTLGAVPWDPAPWSLVGEAGPDQRTPDLAPLVQEIVDRPGWSAGNAMAFVITGSGRRTAEAYDGDRDRAPVLEIEYLCADDLDGDGFACQLDCDEEDPSVHPGAAELCDGRDNDCDGAVDEGDAVGAPLWYADFDGDGYGNAAQTTNACTQPPGWVADASDCDDFHHAVHPGAPDLCDGLDNDCDGTAIDEDFQPQITSCGVGTCGATGVLECVAGSLVDSCKAGPPPSADDATCDGVRRGLRLPGDDVRRRGLRGAGRALVRVRPGAG
jgi:hypothetical protein